MKVRLTVLVVLNAACLCLARPTFPQNSGSSAVVSVQDLAMSRKAMRAFEKGAARLAKGDPQGSIQYFHEAAERAPSSYRPYHNLGLAYYQLAQFDEAIKNFQKAIDLSKGTFAPSLFGLSMIFYRGAEYQQAESLIEQGLYVAPRSAIGRYCLGLVQFSQGRTDEAERNAKEALRLDPRESDVYILLGHIHERRHDSSAVVNDVRAYFQLTRNRELQDDALGLLHRAQENGTPVAATFR